MCVCLSGSHTFLVVTHRYVSQATRASIGMLPLCLSILIPLWICLDRRRHYDPAIIETTIGLVLGPFTALYRSFLKRCTLTNKAVGTL